MNILLINPPYNTDLSPGSFPLGLGYIAAVLQNSGHRVEVLDIKACRYSPSEVEAYLKRNIHRFDLAGITGMITVYSAIKWLTGVIKEIRREIPVMVGGSAASSAPELLMENTMADILCIGEAEESVVEVVKALEEEGALDDIRGICFRKGGAMVRTLPREPIACLDDIPYPAWDLFPMEIYLKRNLIIPTEKKSMNTIFSRGCPYNCTFCYRNMGNSVRVRSVENMIGELKVLKHNYGISHLEFQDELFIVNRTMSMELARRITEEELDLQWRCLGRANLIDDDLLRELRRAGCRWIGFGVESGSQRMLDGMKKSVRIDQVKKAVHKARTAGMEVSGTFIMGMPGETVDSIRETIDFCKEMSLYNEFFFPVPYPGTELYEIATAGGMIRADEDFVTSLGRDMTELVVNFTDYSDEELKSLKQSAEMEIRGHLSAKMDLGSKAVCTVQKGHNFTQYFSDAANRVIEKHLDYIAREVSKAFPAVRSMILIGGFGRGEGSILMNNDLIVPLNDYDIVLVCEPTLATTQPLAQRLAKEIGIRHIDLLPHNLAELRSLPPTQFNYDMKYGGFTFWGEEFLGWIPEYRAADISLDSGRVLLMNRLICLLECFNESITDNPQEADQHFFLEQQSAKAVLALGEALLMGKKRYHFSAMKRRDLMTEFFPSEEKLLKLHNWAVDFKLFPGRGKSEKPASLWFEVVDVYLRVLSLYFSAPASIGTLPGIAESSTLLYDLLSGQYRGGDKEVLETAEISLLAAILFSESERTLFSRISQKNLKTIGVDVRIVEPWEKVRAKTVEKWFGMFH